MPDEHAANPLLDFSGLPRLDAIRPEHVAPAIELLVDAARNAIDVVATDSSPASWDNVAEPLADALDRLNRAWAAVQHLNAVVSTPALRDAYHANLPKITAFFADLALDARIFGRYRALADSPSFAALDPARQRAIANELRDFRLGGAELSHAKKARFKAVEEDLAELSARFDDNLLDATNAWALHVEDAAELAGVPRDVLAEARAAAAAEGRHGWKLTLRMPCYQPVMSYAENRALRATLHRANATRASDLGASPQWDNTAVIRRILELRREAALLLGYTSYAEVSLVPKMARSVDEVLLFLRDLARRAKPFAQRDYVELLAFARERLGIDDLAPWDLAYASEKLKAARFAFSEQEVRQYFPEHMVLAGLFRAYGGAIGVSDSSSPRPAYLNHTISPDGQLDKESVPTIGRFLFRLSEEAIRVVNETVEPAAKIPPGQSAFGVFAGTFRSVVAGVLQDFCTTAHVSPDALASVQLELGPGFGLRVASTTRRAGKF